MIPVNKEVKKKLGGLQNAITNKAGINVPTSIIMIGVVKKPFVQIGTKRVGSEQVKFETFSLQIQFYNVKRELQKILAHMCNESGLDSIDWSTYDTKGDAFVMNSLLCKYFWKS